MSASNRLAIGLLLAATLAACGPAHDPTTRASGSGLVVGVLFDESGLLGYYGQTGRPGIELALLHLNQAGGVLGHPVRALHADTRTDVAASIEAARGLAEAGAHAFVGPLGSAATIAVTEAVAVPREIPIVTPTATSPDLSARPDAGFLFRTTASDLVQAPVLARLAEREGARHVAAFHQDDNYGRGLVAALREQFDGLVTAVAIQDGQQSFADELTAAAVAGADTLIAMSYVPTAITYLREGHDLGLFERVLLVDATASLDLVDALGAEVVEGMKGTAPAGTLPWLDTRQAPDADTFARAFERHFGHPPTNQLEAAAYDIVLCLGFAAERAGSVDGAALRDALPVVCGSEGEALGPGAEAVSSILEALRAERSIRYRGSSGAIAWDQNGDLAIGTIVVWQFADGEIEAVESVPFDLRSDIAP